MKDLECPHLEEVDQDQRKKMKDHPLTIRYKCGYCGRDAVGHGYIAFFGKENPTHPLPCAECMRAGKDLEKDKPL